MISVSDDVTPRISTVVASRHPLLNHALGYDPQSVSLVS